MTTHIHDIKRLAKFITYILGHRPDEFGLIPDGQGFVKSKSLLKAVNEEPGWRYVRLSHLHELTLSLQPSPIEMNANLIRANDRADLPGRTRPSQLPKLLFTAVRRRAYPVVLEKGIPPGGDGYIVLSGDEQMAIRLGRRMDNDPVILTVHTNASPTADIAFQQYGIGLYLAQHIPVEAFSGPPLPKERPAEASSAKPKEPAAPKTPGSYFPDPLPIKEDANSVTRRRNNKEKAWQRERRQARKQKQRNT
jgi:putative RNA 2'-phosphotransferase